MPLATKCQILLALRLEPKGLGLCSDLANDYRDIDAAFRLSARPGDSSALSTMLIRLAHRGVAEVAETTAFLARKRRDRAPAKIASRPAARVE